MTNLLLLLSWTEGKGWAVLSDQILCFKRKEPLHWLPLFHPQLETGLVAWRGTCISQLSVEQRTKKMHSIQHVKLCES